MIDFKPGNKYLCQLPNGAIKALTIIKTSFVFDTLMAMDNLYIFYSLESIQIIEKINHETKQIN